MIIRTAGPYAATMGSTYNSRPLTPEVLVQGHQWAVVRERRDVEAFLRDEQIPDLASALGRRLVLDLGREPLLDRFVGGAAGGRIGGVVGSEIGDADPAPRVDPQA